MDPKSGIFTAPMAGSYLFIVHVCSADMHKALLSIRQNGNEVASFYDQNHESNHKNSMVGQSVLLDLKQGDKIQVSTYLTKHKTLKLISEKQFEKFHCLGSIIHYFNIEFS